MSFHFDSSEMRHLEVDLTKAPASVQRKASRAIRKTAFDIEADAKILAPVDTGNLKNSISTDVTLLSAEIGPTASYGYYVENGTRYQSPQPYMRPAFDRRAPGLAQALADAGGEIL